jgi:D-cysteine desulfhydrase
MVNYPEKLNLAQTPTPFYPLERLSEQLGGPRIWIKRDDLTGAATSGNKVRKLEFLLAEALANGCDTLITSGGVQSNHCRSVALLGAQLGLKVHLLLRADIEPKPVGNLLLDQLAGATISHYSLEEYRGLDKLFAQWQDHYAGLGRNAYSIPTGGSNGTGMWGYITAAEELSQDFQRNGIQPQAIVHATGSAGTQAGLMLGCQLHQINTKVKAYAVCDNRAYFTRKVREDLQQWQNQYSPQTDISGLVADTCDEYVGPAYGVAGDEVFDAIKQVAALEGILLDPVYTGKAFFGMMEDIKKGKFSSEQGDDIVFLHTGGLFGLFAQQHRLGYESQP